MGYPRSHPAPNPPRTFRRGLADESRASVAPRGSRTSGWRTCTSARDVAVPQTRCWTSPGSAIWSGSIGLRSSTGRDFEPRQPSKFRLEAVAVRRVLVVRSSGMGSAAIVAVVATGGRESTRASFTRPDRRFPGEPERAGPHSRVPHRPAVRTDTEALLSAREVWRAIRPGNP